MDVRTYGIERGGHIVRAGDPVCFLTTGTPRCERGVLVRVIDRVSTGATAHIKVDTGGVTYRDLGIVWRVDDDQHYSR